MTARSRISYLQMELGIGLRPTANDQRSTGIGNWPATCTGHAESILKAHLYKKISFLPAA
jgi:hypothetical protein